MAVDLEKLELEQSLRAQSKPDSELPAYAQSQAPVHRGTRRNVALKLFAGALAVMSVLGFIFTFGFNVSDAVVEFAKDFEFMPCHGHQDSAESMTAVPVGAGSLPPSAFSTSQNVTGPPKKKNIIFMVSDGMGPASLSMTRSYRQYVNKLAYNDILTLDQNFIGHSRTRSTSSLITDSAAGATAFSCGKKSYNGAISVLDDKSACGTVLEGAKLAGYTTGLVVRTRITDATPACFAAHARDRSMEDIIAEHELGIGHPIGAPVDLLMGGGLCHFLPATHPLGCRNDERDLVSYAKENGWTVASTLPELKRDRDEFNTTLPVLGLFAPTDMPFELDRIAPTLAEMTTEALGLLAANIEESDQGFFLLIEGSRIDHAGHSNDPAAQVEEVLAYDEAFRTALEFAKSRDDTVLIATSDHETGGLTVGKQPTRDYPDYIWFPEALSKVQHSSEYVARELKNFSGSKKQLRKYVVDKIAPMLGVDHLTKKEVKKLVKHRKNAQETIVKIVSKRANVGWTTHGHTAVDVNVYGYGVDELRGSNENTDIGNFMASYLGVDLETVTEKIQKINTKQ